MDILVVGLGSIAKKHIEVIKQLEPNSRIYALRSQNPSNQYTDVINLYSWDDVKTPPGFILITSPTVNHAEDIIQASKWQRPLFIEKPIFESIEGKATVLDRIYNLNIKTYIACVLRFHPCIQFLKKVDWNTIRINEINVYCGSYLPNWRPSNDFRNSYSVDASRGGGVHLDLIHEIDYICHLFGVPDNTTAIRTKKSSLNINSSDYANYMLEYKYFNVSVILNYYRNVPKRQCELVFDNDIWLVDMLSCTITNKNNEIVFIDNKYTIANIYKEQMKYFISNLESVLEFENNYKTAFEVLKICLI